MEKDKPAPASDEPLEIEVGDRDVQIGIPDDGTFALTSDAAEVSALRLLDAADRSRGKT